MDVSKKRWDYTLGCWVLDTSPSHAGLRYWDSKKGEWVDEVEVGKPEKAKEPYTASSCGTPYYTPSPNYAYQPTTPFQDLDRTKWPNTWWTLFTLFYQRDWHVGGVYISDWDYRDRLKGIYRVEPKRYSGYYSWGENE